MLSHVTVSSQPQSLAPEDFVPVEPAPRYPVTVFEGAIVNGDKADRWRPRRVRREADGQTSSSHQEFARTDRDKYPRVIIWSR